MNERIDEILSILDDDVSKEILKESERCFKIGADRAALLFGFSSLMQAIKNRLIKIGKPKDVSDTDWGSFYHDLLDDDKMEKIILSEIRKNSSKYFSIEDKLRRDITYWIDRRNACAHWKISEDISSEMVDVFYLFYLKNIYRFQLGSSSVQIIKDLEDIYDITKTRPGTSPEPVIRRINYSIRNEEFDDFLDNLIDSYEWRLNSESPLLEITENMYKILSDEKLGMLTSKIRVHSKWASLFLEKYNRYFNWVFKSKEELFQLVSSGAEGVCKLFKLFDKKGLLIKDSLNDDYERFYAMILEKKIDITDGDEDIITDQLYNWFITNLDRYLNENWSWLNDNSRADTFIKILRFRSPDVDVCKKIIDYFSHPQYSFFFLERFSYEDSKNFNALFLKVVDSNALTMPKKLKDAMEKRL